MHGHTCSLHVAMARNQPIQLPCNNPLRPCTETGEVKDLERDQGDGEREGETKWT